MSFDELNKQIEQDLKINLTDLAYESANNALLQHKYIKMLTETKVKYRQKWTKHQQTKKDRYMYYNGHAEKPYEYELDSAGMKFHMAGDDQIIKEQNELFLLEEKIKFLEDTCAVFNNRGYNIKSTMSWLAFQSGTKL